MPFSRSAAATSPAMNRPWARRHDEKYMKQAASRFATASSTTLPERRLVVWLARVRFLLETVVRGHLIVSFTTNHSPRLWRLTVRPNQVVEARCVPIARARTPTLPSTLFRLRHRGRRCRTSAPSWQPREHAGAAPRHIADRESTREGFDTPLGGGRHARPRGGRGRAPASQLIGRVRQ